MNVSRSRGKSKVQMDRMVAKPDSLYLDPLGLFCTFTSDFLSLWRFSYVFYEILPKCGYMSPGSIVFMFGTQQSLIIAFLSQSVILTLKVLCFHLLPPPSLYGAGEHPRSRHLWARMQDLRTCCPLTYCGYLLFWQMMWKGWNMRASEILRHL